MNGIVSPSVSRRRYQGRLLATVVMSVLLSPLAGAGVAGAGPTFTGPFDARASADGMRVTVSSGGFPLVQSPVDGGGPSAQASLDNLGTSRGYAAFPNPGEFVYLLPGIAGGLLSLPMSLPVYPLAVSSDADSRPEASAGAGPYQLVAKSEESSSRASAVTGGATAAGTAGLLSAEASTLSDGSAVAATARSTTDAATIGPLTLGKVVSEAAAKMGGDGSLTRSSTLRVTGATLNGAGLEFTPEGLVFAGTTQPVDQGSVDEVLQGAGLSIKTFPAEDTAGGVVAPVFEVTQQTTVPGLGPVTVVYRFGGAVASVAGQVEGADSGPRTDASKTPEAARSSVGPAFGPQEPTPNGTGAFGEPGQDGALKSVLSPAGSGGPAQRPPSEFATAGLAVEDQERVSAAGSGSPESAAAGPVMRDGTLANQSRDVRPILAAAARSSATSGDDISSVYLVLVVAGVAGLVAMQVIRLLGVRLS